MVISERNMQRTTVRYSFKDILHLLAKQKPEEKLRVAFRLNCFVKKLREEGKKYGKTQKRSWTRATA